MSNKKNAAKNTTKAKGKKPRLSIVPAPADSAAAETMPQPAEQPGSAPLAADNETPATTIPDGGKRDSGAKTGTKTKARASAKPAKDAKPKQVSALDAAAQVLVEAGAAMTCQELVDAMTKQKLWTSPNGQTPDRTLYAAMTREINAKRSAARFAKADRGKFTAAGK